jgi:hypothetical protein
MWIIPWWRLLWVNHQLRKFGSGSLQETSSSLPDVNQRLFSNGSYSIEARQVSNVLLVRWQIRVQ